MRLQHGRGGHGWRRQENLAQPIGDGNNLGGLLVAKAPRGDLAVRGSNAASGWAAAIFGANEGGSRGALCVLPKSVSLLLFFYLKKKKKKKKKLK